MSSDDFILLSSGTILLDTHSLPRGLLCSTLAMRIFVALDLDPAIRQRIQDFMEEVRGLAPDARWVTAESLHVTLKFIGEKPDTKVSQIVEALSSIRAEPFHLRFSGT